MRGRVKEWLEPGGRREETATLQRMGSGNKETDPSLQPLEGMQACQPFDFRVSAPPQPPMWENKFVFKPLSLCPLITATTENEFTLCESWPCAFLPSLISTIYNLFTCLFPVTPLEPKPHQGGDFVVVTTLLPAAPGRGAVPLKVCVVLQMALPIPCLTGLVCMLKTVPHHDPWNMPFLYQQRQTLPWLHMPLSCSPQYWLVCSPWASHTCYLSSHGANGTGASLMPDRTQSGYPQ